jgi:hypothetical protein
MVIDPSNPAKPPPGLITTAKKLLKSVKANPVLDNKRKKELQKLTENAKAAR